MEPALSFAHASLKLEWANIRLQELQTVCNTFNETKPHVAFLEADPETSTHALKVGMSRKIPAEIPLIAGDVVSNMRSALDIAWMGLVRAAGTKVKKATMPIADNRKGLITMDIESTVGGAAEKAKLLLADAIKSHRDFANGGNESIVALNELCNWNKHNMLMLQMGRTVVRNINFGSGNNIGVVIGDGDISSIIGFGNKPPANFSYEGEPSGEIIFGRHYLLEDQPVLPSLVNLLEATREALQAFREAFPGTDNPVDIPA